MKAFLSILGLICVLGGGAPARADVTGPVCVTNGNVIMVNGTRWYGKCTGGTEVRLFGIVAPELSQICEGPGGQRWQCGRASAAMLLEAVKNEKVTCEGKSADPEGRLLAVCRVRGEDLNRRMVREGWALAYPHHSAKYEEEEKRAAQARKGLWQMPGTPAFEWRNQ
ncbi:thermonuclease family protein [Shumkonia mesophila]|uniref:thermonuclease family protein n=1 Tax=Shumkonia mesophila TaxID=2838854 RepID=UPI0029345D25|nr:thermonuclease family protein [Shumkonia mesophila]